MKRILLITAALMLPSLAQAQQADAAKAEAMFNQMFAKNTPEWMARVTQDETQKICSATKNEPSGADFDKIVAREKASLVFPADGKVMGDWKAGRNVAQRGTGGQFSDAPGTFQGGNCYACHQLSKAELSFGNLGPSLNAYGKDRKYDPEEAKNAYAKIYNAQSVQACSTMPRFGHNKFLTEQQIKDVVAYLFDPESPVNK
ncbi:MAG: sulfur oxidation c-type cytochrome SoxX [Beijerinckiaceae bacterium]